MMWLFHKVIVLQIIKSLHCTHNVCEGICNRKIINILYYSKYEVLPFDDDKTGPANEYKRTKRVQGWSRQIMEGSFYYLQCYYFRK